ncbi:MAG TPA: transglycosylase domain-containing protein [Microbacteriaceae bacterium]|nr:transglycosylase domain-containing protein [Microbacteriaceae bacterium]
MAATEHRPWRALGALTGFVALSAIAGLLATAAVAPALAVTGIAAKDSIGAFDGLPEYIKVDPLPQASTMFATQGGKPVPIATFYAQNRVEVGWADIAPTVRDAAIATEDPRFYEHGGIDLTGTLRGAVLTMLKKDVQGGSSITQQYVKNILVQQCESAVVNPATPETANSPESRQYRKCYDDATAVDPVRKLREMRYAIGLEKRYSKDEILLSYLNIALFGGRIYGIESASEYYFGVPAKNLTLAQAATLMAIPNNPDNLRIDQPTKKVNGAADGYKETLARRDYVLNRMLATGKITRAQHDEAMATKLEPKITPVESGCMTAQQVSSAFFCDYVQRVILKDPIFGKTTNDRVSFLNRGGLQIYTTLNLDLQAVAQQSISAYIPPTSPRLDLGAANVSTEVGTGRIITMAQNRPYDNTGTPAAGTTAINYNTDYAYGGSEGFQTGSAYKVFDLLQWLKEGHSLNETIDASQHTFAQSRFHSSPPCADIGGLPWQVANDEGSATKLGVLPATAESVNSAFAMMATKLDLCGIKQSAQSLLLHGANERVNRFMANPSSVIGTNYIAPLSMATAYAGLANGGLACSAIAIDRITTADGSEHPVPKSVCSTNPIDPKIAAGVIFALQGVLRSGGTAASANPRDGVPIFGKTGTTDHSLENWLVTSTTKVSQATWVGNIQGSVPLRSQSFHGVGGGNVKFSITRPILAALNATYGGGAFPAVDATFLRAPTPPPATPQAPAPPAPPPAPAAAPNNGGGNSKGGGKNH